MNNRNSTRFFLPAIIMLCLMITLPQVIRAQAFEGEISMQMGSPMMGAQKMDILYSIKGTKLLQTADDPQAGKIAVYSDLKTGTQTIVQEAQKQGMQIDQKVMDSLMNSMKIPSLVPKATGKKEKIGSYDCEVYVITIDSTQEMDMWLTKDLPKDVTTAIKNCTEEGLKSTGMKSDDLMAVFDKGYAQIKMEVKQNGITQMTNQFIKAEPKKLADALFVIPADIKISKYDPATMGGGAGGQ